MERGELVSHAIALGAERRWDEMLGLCDPAIEWRDQMHAPDVPEVLHGIEELRSMIDRWDAAYDGLTQDVEEFIEQEPWVICVTRWHAVGKGSGISVDVRSVDAYEVLDSRITRVLGGYADVAGVERAIAECSAG